MINSVQYMYGPLACPSYFIFHVMAVFSNDYNKSPQNTRNAMINAMMNAWDAYIFVFVVVCMFYHKLIYGLLIDPC